MVARRSATSTLAFCTQTLWKAAGRVQVDTGRHLRVGVVPIERLLGTRAPSLTQTPSDSGPTRWAHRPSLGPTHERDRCAHADKDGQTAPGRAVTLAHRHCPAACVVSVPSDLSPGHGKGTGSHPLGPQAAKPAATRAPQPQPQPHMVPSSAQSSPHTPLMLRISQRRVGLRVATLCPSSRASSSSERAPWRKWALRGPSLEGPWNQVSVTYRDPWNWAPSQRVDAC